VCHRSYSSFFVVRGLAARAFDAGLSAGVPADSDADADVFAALDFAGAAFDARPVVALPSGSTFALSFASRSVADAFAAPVAFVAVFVTVFV
jgi:hypothetical protein